ncbi:MFS transporter [Candidatus Bathyarchaeota archaeon]|nr:MAG: MFS transporter [Candidatus Bathyarchaeota archaeon]
MEQLVIEKSEDALAKAASLVKTRTRLILALIITAGFLDVIDFSIVQVALPTIQTELVVSIAESQWIIGAYGLTLAGFLLLSGRAGDIYGQKKLFVFGIVLFTVASFTGGLAPSLLSLIISRAIQGIGAAVSTATAFAILVTTFPEGRERNRALGIFVSVLSAGFAAGSISGGILTSAFGWRSVLFVNVPIGTVAAIFSQRYLANNPGRAMDKHLDLPGALSVTSGLILLVYALTNAANDGFTSIQTVLPFGLGALVLAGFVAIEYRSKSPLMPLAFLRRGTVFTANVLALILTSSAGGVIFLLTIYLQRVSGYLPLAAGLEFVPAALIFFFVGGWGSSWLVSRLGLKQVLVISMGLITFGSALLTQISVTSGYFGILPGMLLWSLGASIGFPALNIAALAGTKRGEEGLASGIIGTSQRVGFPLGLAMLLTIATVTDPPPAGVASQLGSLTGVVTGFQYAFLASTIISAIGLLIALRVKNPRMRVERLTFS